MPGPWVVVPATEDNPAYTDENGRFNIEERGTDAQFVIAATVGDVSSIRGHEEANANLIAAAPDLYAALEICLALRGQTLKTALNLNGQSPFDIGMAALRKARGEQP